MHDASCGVNWNELQRKDGFANNRNCAKKRKFFEISLKRCVPVSKDEELLRNEYENEYIYV